MGPLPAGTVTFLFTDIEGSTRLLQEQPGAYGDVLAQHRALLRGAFASRGGIEIGTQGDSFFVAFVRARDAVAAAVEAQQALATHAWPDGVVLRVRMGLHTGEPKVSSEGYIGLGVHRAARICSAGHGGQVLLSDATRQLIQDELPAGIELSDLGVHRLKDLDRPEHLFQAAFVGARSDFPPLKAVGPVDGEPMARHATSRRETWGRKLLGRPEQNGARAARGREPRSGAVYGPPEPDAHGAREPARGRGQRALASATKRRVRAHHAAVALLAAGVVVASMAVLAALRREGGTSPWPGVALDLAKDSVAGFRAGAHRPDVAIPLVGRPTGMATANGRVFVTTVSSAALTVVDGRSRSIIQTIPLRLKPGAVAVTVDRVYVLDPRGTVQGFRTGYDRPTRRITYRRQTAASADPSRSTVRPSASLVADGDVLWATDGSSLLRRIDPRSGRVVSIPVGRSLDGVAIGDRAAWAFSARPASVVRVDRRRNKVTDIIPIVNRLGADAPFPIGIATTPGTVWVLNGNTATLTRIDAHQRGVIDTVQIGIDRAPRGIAASGRTVWVANADGSLSRLAPGARTPSSVWVGQSLGEVSVDRGSVWVTTSALDQQLPG